MTHPIHFSTASKPISSYTRCSSSQNVIKLFYTTFSSPNDFLLNHSDGSSFSLTSLNTCISLSLTDNVTYIKSDELRKQKNNWYTYLIELNHSKKTISLINKIQKATKNRFLYCRDLCSDNNISLNQIYFIDSNNRAFHTGLLELSNPENIKVQAIKQFRLNPKLKTKIRKYTSNGLQSSQRMTIDLQNKAIQQLQNLEKSKNLVFGKTDRQEEGKIAPFYLPETVNKEAVQLSVLHWLEYFLQTYKENPEYSVRVLMDNRKILLSQICSHIERDRFKPYNYSQHIPSTLPSLELLFVVLKKIYAEKNLTNENILEFLLPIEKDAVPTSFIIEEYYHLPVGRSYIYLFREMLKERRLQPEIFLRINKAVSCKYSSNSATFLLRLKRALKSAKLQWKLGSNRNGIYNLYPLMKDLDACRIHDNRSLRQRVSTLFSYDKISFKKVLNAFYTIERRMKRKDCYPEESEEKIISLAQIEEKLQLQKEIYPKTLQECQDRNKQAKERFLKEKEEEIADLEKLIKKVENWKPDDDFQPFPLFSASFCMLFRPENIESIKRKAYSARQDALRELENWERNQKSQRHYEQGNALGLFGLIVPSLYSTSPKQRESEIATSTTYENPVDLELQRRLENLRKDSFGSEQNLIDSDLRRRLENLRKDSLSSEQNSIDLNLRRRLDNLRA